MWRTQIHFCGSHTVARTCRCTDEDAVVGSAMITS